MHCGQYSLLGERTQESRTGRKAFPRGSLDTLERMEHPLAQEGKASSPISLPFDELQLRHVTLDHPVTDPPGETSSHGIFVFLDRSPKGLQFGKFAAGYLGQPGVEAFSSAVAQHLGKLLNQVIGQLDLRVKLTKLSQRFLFLDTEFFRTTKKEESGLSWSRQRRCPR